MTDKYRVDFHWIDAGLEQARLSAFSTIDEIVLLVDVEQMGGVMACRCRLGAAAAEYGKSESHGAYRGCLNKGMKKERSRKRERSFVH